MQNVLPSADAMRAVATNHLQCIVYTIEHAARRGLFFVNIYGIDLETLTQQLLEDAGYKVTRVSDSLRSLEFRVRW